MKSSIIRTILYSGLGMVAATVIVTAVWAGGFYLSVDLPSSADPALKNAALVIRVAGCHNPSEANLSARAEGIVDGKRQSRPVRLLAVSEGVWALPAQKPSRGVWVLAVTGTYLEATRSALVALDADGAVATITEGGAKKPMAQTFSRAFSPKEVEAALVAVADRETVDGGITGHLR